MNLEVCAYQVRKNRHSRFVRQYPELSCAARHQAAREIYRFCACKRLRDAMTLSICTPLLLSLVRSTTVSHTPSSPHSSTGETRNIGFERLTTRNDLPFLT